jgi:hypothetical protein
MKWKETVCFAFATLTASGYGLHNLQGCSFKSDSERLAEVQLEADSIEQVVSDLQEALNRPGTGYPVDISRITFEGLPQVDSRVQDAKTKMQADLNAASQDLELASGTTNPRISKGYVDAAKIASDNAASEAKHIKDMGGTL